MTSYGGHRANYKVVDHAPVCCLATAAVCVAARAGQLRNDATSGRWARFPKDRQLPCPLQCCANWICPALSSESSPQRADEWTSVASAGRSCPSVPGAAPLVRCAAVVQQIAGAAKEQPSSAAVDDASSCQLARAPIGTDPITGVGIQREHTNRERRSAGCPRPGRHSLGCRHAWSGGRRAQPA